MPNLYDLFGTTQKSLPRALFWIATHASLWYSRRRAAGGRVVAGRGQLKSHFHISREFLASFKVLRLSSLNFKEHFCNA